MTISFCASDDFERIDQLLDALGHAGATSELFEIGVGLNEFFLGAERLTIYRDAWHIDIEGPDDLVKRVIDLLQ